MTGEQYVRALRDQWRIVAVVTLVGLLVAVAAVLLVPKKYTASVDTFVLPAGSTPDTSSAYEGGLLSQQRVKSYVQLFTGGRVSDVVIDRLGLPMTSSELTDEMSVSIQTDSVIITLGVEDSSPERALLIANTSADVFRTLVAELEQPPDARTSPATSIKVVAPAKLADRPTFPPRSLFLAAGVALGLLCGVGLALWRDSLGRPIRSATDLADVGGAPGLGTVLKATRESESFLPAEFSPEIEALRQVRTALQFVDIGHRRKIVLITSAVEAEGKTNLACSLAAVLAAGGHRTLLIDADLRRPGAGERTGLDQSVGITTVMMGRITAEEAVQRHSSGFAFLASGALPPNPSEILASEQMDTLLAWARERYEYVIVDSAPLLPVTDAAAIAARTDGVVLACRFGSTLDIEVREAVRILGTVQANVWGTVLTMAPHRGAGPRRYGSYGQPVEAGPARDAGTSPKRPSPSPLPTDAGVGELDSPTVKQPSMPGGNGRPAPRPHGSHASPPSR